MSDDEGRHVAHHFKWVTILVTAEYNASSEYNEQLQAVGCGKIHVMPRHDMYTFTHIMICFYVCITIIRWLRYYYC
jgi:hypothetical protein